MIQTTAMRILICDDQAITREGLALLLNLERDIEVVGTAEDGAQAIELTARLLPDLVLMDLKMPFMNGVEATRHIRARHPQISVLVLTTYDDEEWIFDAIRAGASGYLLKDTPREELVKAVRGTVSGKAYVDPAVTHKLLQQLANVQTKPATQLSDKLSEREVEVLRLIGRGLNNADIADQLHLAEGTVRNHVSLILSKLEVTDRTQAALLAVQHGLR